MILITGHGRSGTKWLARELGKSELLHVEHEQSMDSRFLRSCHEDAVKELMDRRFHRHDGKTYVAVNSELRAIAPYLMQRGVHVAVLLRHPEDIISSIAARKKISLIQATEFLRKGFYEVGYLLDLCKHRWSLDGLTGTYTSESRKMNDWNRLCLFVGADDLLAQRPNMTPEDVTEKKPEWSAQERAYFNMSLGWYKSRLNQIEGDWLLHG